jgi:hypothetical protein
MSAKGWHIMRDHDAGLTLARQLPVRFDVSAEALFPVVGRLRLATQVRQDLWRILQQVRGFTPVIRVQQDGDQLRLTAGGQVSGRAPKDQIERQISDLLASPSHRARWVRNAGGTHA